MGHARAATFVGSAGRLLASSRACCGPGAVSVVGEWLCVAGLYRFHGGGGALGSGVGWVRGRPPAGSGCRGLTLGRSSAVPPCCILWWPLVGWQCGAFCVYRIHGGTTVCWRAAVEDVVGCGGGACVGVVRVVCGDASCVVLGGSSCRSVVAVRGGWSWAWRFLGGCGTCGVGMAGRGGARVCGPALRPSLFFFGPWCPRRVCPQLPPRFPLLTFPCPSLFACSFCFFFLGGGRVRLVRVGRLWCWAWVWVRVGAGVGVGVGDVGVGRLLRSGFPVCVSALRHLVDFHFRGAGPGGAGGELSAAAVVRCLCGWLRLPGSARVAWLDAGVRVGVFEARAVWVVGSRLLGAGRLLWAWLVLCCPAWAVVWVRFAWVGWGGVPGMCAPKAWWVGLRHFGRCNGWWRCW